MEDFVVPGDTLGSIEEMEAGNNTFDDGTKIRACTIGIANIDKKNKRPGLHFADWHLNMIPYFPI